MHRSVASKFKRLFSLYKWYIKCGLYHPVALSLLILSIVFYFVIVRYQEEPYRTATVRPLLEYIIIPLYALSTALLIQTRSQETIFELNLFKNWRLIYLSKILIFILSLIKIIAGVVAINIVTGYTAIKSTSLIARVLSISAIVGISITIKSPRAGYLFLITSLLILPVSAMVVAHGIIQIGERINPILSIVLYLLSPINMDAFVEYMDISYDALLISVTLIALVVIVLFMLIFEHQEYTLD